MGARRPYKLQTTKEIRSQKLNKAHNLYNGIVVKSFPEVLLLPDICSHKQLKRLEIILHAGSPPPKMPMSTP